MTLIALLTFALLTMAGEQACAAPVDPAHDVDAVAYEHSGSIQVPQVARPYTVSVWKLAFSTDGALLAVACGDGALRVFEVPSKRLLHEIRTENGGVYSVEFSPDGSKMAYGGKEASLWNLQTESQITSALGKATRSYAMAFSPDSTKLAIGAYVGEYKIWDLDTGAAIASFDPTAGAGPIDVLYKPTTKGLNFSPDGAYLAAHTDFFDEEHPPLDRVQVWTVASGELKAAFRGSGCILAPNSNTLAYSDGDSIHLLDVDALEEKKRIECPFSVELKAFAPDGKSLASSSDKAVHIWDAQSGEQVAQLSGHQGRVTSVAFAPDGQLLASSDKDGEVRLWSMTQPEAMP